MNRNQGREGGDTFCCLASRCVEQGFRSATLMEIIRQENIRDKSGQEIIMFMLNNRYNFNLNPTIQGCIDSHFVLAVCYKSSSVLTFKKMNFSSHILYLFTILILEKS